jgi:hypothetical protein
MATAYRFARVVAPDNVNPLRSTSLTAKLPGSSTTVTLYTDPTLTAVLSSSGVFTTDSTGFAEFCTSAIPNIDIYNGSTLVAANVPVGVFYPIDAPLGSSGTIPKAYTDAAATAISGGTVSYTNMPRVSAGVNGAIGATGVMTSAAVYLPAGITITNLTFMSATTALGTGTHWWFALYSTAATPALLAQTADQTSTAWAANTAVTLPLASPYVTTTAGVYYASVMVAASTVPTLVSATALGSAGVLSTDKILAQTSGSSLTTTAPATITGATTVTNVPYVALS